MTDQELQEIRKLPPLTDGELRQIEADAAGRNVKGNPLAHPSDVLRLVAEVRRLRTAGEISRPAWVDNPRKRREEGP
jgi:hypothetical protein